MLPKITETILQAKSTKGLTFADVCQALFSTNEFIYPE